jgi:hypothetical protein
LGSGIKSLIDLLRQATPDPDPLDVFAHTLFDVFASTLVGVSTPVCLHMAISGTVIHLHRQCVTLIRRQYVSLVAAE